MTLTTLIAELEEALKAATDAPWIVSSQNKKYVEGGTPSDHNGFRHLVSDSYTGLDDVDEANARLIALMRNSLPTLLEALTDMQDRLEQIQDIASADGDMTAALVSISVIASNTGKQIAEGFGLTAHKEKSDV